MPTASPTLIGQFAIRLKEPLLQWKAWTRKGAFSVADLGLTSAANCGINILMARSLTEREYGAFSVAYATLLFAMGFQTSYILEPLSVLGPRRSIDAVRPYRDSVFWLNLIATVALSAFIALWAAFAGDATLRWTLLSCSLSGPFIMAFWFLRRLYYLESDSSSAAVSSLVYAVALTVLGICLRAMNHLSTPSAMIAMGAASLLASVHSYRRYFSRLTWRASTILRSAAEHWHYGKWPVGASVLSLGSTNLQTFLVAFSSGLGAAGVLRAMQNLVIPAQQVVAALGTFIIPVLSRDIGAGQRTAAHRKAALYFTVVVGLTSAYAVCLLLFKGTVEELLYGGKFKQYLSLLQLNGLIPVLIACTSGFSVLLRANQKPRHLLTSAIAGAAVGFASALPFSRMWGVWGAISSVALSNLAIMLTTAWYYLAHRKESLYRAAPVTEPFPQPCYYHEP